MKKGFTLIELLSVLVIISIILVIAIPQIMNVVKIAREDTLKSSVKMIASEIEREYGINHISNEVSTSGNCPEELTSWDISNIDEFS